MSKPTQDTTPTSRCATASSPSSARTSSSRPARAPARRYSLAMRMAAGIAAGTYTVEHMAAVTFTRKAAAELRGRFQLALEERLAREAVRRASASVSRRRSTGIERLFAGTIHAFCAHLLRERPVDARVAPGFEELERRRQPAAAQAGLARLRRDGAGRGLPPLLDLLDAGIRPEGSRRRVRDRVRARGRRVRQGDRRRRRTRRRCWKAVDSSGRSLAALRPAGVPRGHDLPRAAAVRRVRRPAAPGAPRAVGVAGELLQGVGQAEGHAEVVGRGGRPRQATASRSPSSWPTSRRTSSSRSSRSGAPTSTAWPWRC